MASRIEWYRRLRGTGGIVGEDALRAWTNSATIVRFEEEEEAGNVRILAEPEQEDYFSVYGEPDDPKERAAIFATISRNGLWHVRTEVRDPDSGRWKTADSIGMIDSARPTDAIDNPYGVDLRAEALRELDWIAAGDVREELAQREGARSRHGSNWRNHR